MEWTVWKRGNNHVALQQIIGNMRLLLDYIDEQWLGFFLIITIIRCKSYIANIKKMRIFPLLKYVECTNYLLVFYQRILSPNHVVVVQIDIAQNFALSLQHVAQFAHFDKPQAIVFIALMRSEKRNFVTTVIALSTRIESLSFSKIHEKPLSSRNTKFVFCSIIPGFECKPACTKCSCNELCN